MENQTPQPIGQMPNVPQVPVQNNKPKYLIISSIFIVLIAIIVGFFIIKFNSKPMTDKDSGKINILNTNQTYKDFALSDNTSSFDKNDPRNVRQFESGAGFTSDVLETGDGFARVRASSVQTNLNIPLGWYSLETGQLKTVFYTPDYKTTLVLSLFDGKEMSFLDTKKQSLEEYESYKNEGAKVNSIDLPDGSFANIAVPINHNGKNIFIISVYTPNPEGGQYFMKSSLSGLAEDFDKYRGLVGLVLKDREISWFAFSVLDSESEEIVPLDDSAVKSELIKALEHRYEVFNSGDAKQVREFFQGYYIPDPEQADKVKNATDEELLATAKFAAGMFEGVKSKSEISAFFSRPEVKWQMIGDSAAKISLNGGDSNIEVRKINGQWR